MAVVLLLALRGSRRLQVIALVMVVVVLLLRKCAACASVRKWSRLRRSGVTRCGLGHGSDSPKRGNGHLRLPMLHTTPTPPQAHNT